MAKVLGIGNALVDIIIQLDSDQILEDYKLQKASMQLVTRELSSRLLVGTLGLKRSKATGGSAANTIHGLARMGVETGFIGKIGKDELGDFFSKDMKKKGIQPYLFYSMEETGRAVTLVSPDSERTFGTYLGAAIELAAEDLDHDLFEGYDFLHLEGYLVQNTDLLHKALRLAKHSGLKIFLDLSSYNIVASNLAILKEVITDYVDIVFANEDEARELTGKEPEEALHEMNKLVDIAVVKLGPQGSMVMQDKELYRIDPVRVRSVDTTGAGDLYAAGFIFGLLQDLPLESCGRIGSILGGKVIEVMGAKMDDEHWEDAKQMIKESTYPRF